ncbi:hypothetical protein AGABI2DRAFT_145077 [Agaricus bisporus var. bisporus H97]|uniref:hypothetical protein n=1 Tax=Agaricus bisporus var. bisporus (strain H97 / ATCC MYA-4626 / FGSC 10389) TaxID=936046 RepID=UPI00029F5ED5|nr:hypothetical protein AGABI2DRAFT_145077 [Agaricus bisporus var. bisporus H97]EKV44568.1 hypothetical protein AGABI2DRAFT_145077 [Agaricus bisporus var. bisporus H97]
MFSRSVNKPSEEGGFPNKRPHSASTIVETSFSLLVNDPHKTQMVICIGVPPTIPFRNGFQYTTASKGWWHHYYLDHPKKGITAAKQEWSAGGGKNRVYCSACWNTHRNLIME